MELVTITVEHFKARFQSEKAHRYCTEEIIYSKRILKEHKSVLQYFPKAVHINPHREAEYNDGTKSMKYGWETLFVSATGTEWKFLVKVYLNRAGTLFI